MMTEDQFIGFEKPKANFSKLPHDLVKAFPKFKTMGEVMVTLYILRHTWGFQDDKKRISLDEFMYGRWWRNPQTGLEERLDNGVGMSKTAIIRGLKNAAAHGFIEVEIDKHDRGRVEKFYSIRTQDATRGYRNATSPVSKRYSRGSESTHRTEKETKETNKRKKGVEQTPTPAPIVLATLSGEAWAIHAKDEPIDAILAARLNDLVQEFGDATVAAEIADIKHRKGRVKMPYLTATLKGKAEDAVFAKSKPKSPTPPAHVYSPDVKVIGPADDTQQVEVNSERKQMRDAAYSVVDRILAGKRAS
jgi:DNA-binding PadR family transcriptional regulator